MYFSDQAGRRGHEYRGPRQNGKGGPWQNSPQPPQRKANWKAGSFFSRLKLSLNIGKIMYNYFVGKL